MGFGFLAKWAAHLRAALVILALVSVNGAIYYYFYYDKPPIPNPHNPDPLPMPEPPSPAPKPPEPDPVPPVEADVIDIRVFPGYIHVKVGGEHG